MNRLIQYSSYYIFAVCLVLSPTSLATELNGIARHSEFNKPIYIGALYLDQASTSHMAYTQKNKRMVLKVEAEKLSRRKLNNYWTDGLAINSSTKDFETHTESIIKFSQLLKGNLKKGDTLTIDSQGLSPISISLNGTALGRFSDERFFSLLLAV